MRRNSVVMALTAMLTLVTGAWGTADEAAPHERKEIAGLAIVFGANPEPALTGEVEFLQWRITTLTDNKPYAEMQGGEAVVKRDGQTLGSFPLQAVGRDPGLYQTRHIFTVPGEYQSVLTFRKGEATEVHTIDFLFRIGDRATIEIGGARTGR